MLKSRLLSLLAFAGLALASGPAAAQITSIDPNNADQYATGAPAADDGQYGEAPAEEYAVDPAAEDYVPMAEAAPAADPAVAAPTPEMAPVRDTIPREDIFSAAEGVFGKGAQGLAGIIEDILRDQGEPTAYIAGQEAGGAFVVGVRYGSGTMRHQIEGDRAVYWTGPSVGFDFGADANKVFVLVYNLNDSQDLFRRYPAAEGRAYALGGFTASYLRWGDVVLIPVRLGVGLRLGVNAGYMNFTEKNRWLPF